MRSVLSLLRLAARAGAIACLFLPLTAAPSAATIIGFDDLLGGGVETAPIASPYAGFTWSNVSVLDTVMYTADLGPNGYANGVVSGRNVAYAGYGSPIVVAAAQSFTLASYAIGAAWNNGLSITVQGWRAGVLLNTDSFTVSTTGSILRQPGWADIDSISFAASGGTSAGYRGLGTQFFLDDITLDQAVIGEPSGLGLLMVAAGAGLLFHRRLARSTVGPGAHPPYR